MTAASAEGAGVWALRRPERQLLAGCLLLVALGFLMVLGSGQAAGRRLGLLDLLPLLTYAASLVVIHLTLVLFRFRGDQMLPVVAALLSEIGLLAQYRLGAFEGAELWATVRFIFPGGVLVMLVVCITGMRGHYRRLAACPWVWAGLSLILLAGVLITGQRFRGAIYALGFITPTELLKLTVLLFLAGLIDRDAKALGNWKRPWPIPPFPVPPFRALLPLLGFWALLAGLLFLQRDLGMFVILSVALLVLLVAGTARWGYLIYGVLAATGAGYLMLTLSLTDKDASRPGRHPSTTPPALASRSSRAYPGCIPAGCGGKASGAATRNIPPSPSRTSSTD